MGGCGNWGEKAAGGLEGIAIVRSRTRCQLLRFTILLRVVRGCRFELEGDQWRSRKLSKSYLIWVFLYVYT